MCIFFAVQSMSPMRKKLTRIVLLILFLDTLSYNITAQHTTVASERLITPPAWDGVIDGSGTQHTVSSNGIEKETDKWQVVNNRVSVLTVALFTLAMAAATGLGAIPFFFVELDPQWAGICNGMAAGVMLAASFDLIQEGQDHGSSSWVVLGILAGAIFILLCKKVTTLYESHFSLYYDLGF